MGYVHCHLQHGLPIKSMDQFQRCVEAITVEEVNAAGTLHSVQVGTFAGA